MEGSDKPREIIADAEEDYTGEGGNGRLSTRLLTCKRKADLVRERRMRNTGLKASDGAGSGKLSGQVGITGTVAKKLIVNLILPSREKNENASYKKV